MSYTVSESGFMKRRSFLSFAFCGAMLLPLKLLAAVWNKSAFQAENIEAAQQSLTIDQEIETDQIEITVPSYAENGAIVQLEVRSLIPNTEAIAILVDNNPTPLIGNYLFANSAIPSMITRIKMAETSAIKIIVKSGGEYFAASKQVTVLENGCGGTSNVNEQFASSMKVRAKLMSDSAHIAQVKAIITHPMHTGRGKDDTGQLIPAHFIQLVSIKQNDQPAVEMQLGTGVSKNPYLTFYLNRANLGDQVIVEWHDNLGNTDKKETAVIA